MNHDEAMQRIAQGGEVSGLDRNLWGRGAPPSTFWTPGGYMPRKVAKALTDVADDHGGFEGVVYSYNTPIAVKIGGVWLAPDVKYSATTSTKHQSRLYMLDVEWIPGDAGPEEIRRVLAGKIRYNRYEEKYTKGPR